MNPLLACASTFGGCVLGSIVPVISSEVLLLGISAVSPASLALPLVLAAAAGQIVGKLPYYLAARGVITLPRWEKLAAKPQPRPVRRAAEMLERLERGRFQAPLLLLVSSATG